MLTSGSFGYAVTRNIAAVLGPILTMAGMLYCIKTGFPKTGVLCMLGMLHTFRMNEGLGK